MTCVNSLYNLQAVGFTSTLQKAVNKFTMIKQSKCICSALSVELFSIHAHAQFPHLINLEV